MSLKYLLYKNAVFRKHFLLPTLLVILVPILFTALLLVIKETSDTNPPPPGLPNLPSTPLKPPSFSDLVTSTYATQSCNLDSELTPFNWRDSNPFLICNPSCIGVTNLNSLCTKYKLAIVTGQSSIYTAAGLKNYIETTYPLTATPNDELVITFSSMKELDSYIQSSNYPTSSQINFAIEFQKEPPDSGSVINANSAYYTLRQNGTFYSNPESSRPNVFTTPPTNTLFRPLTKSPSQSCELEKSGGPEGVSSICSTQYGQNGVLTIQRLVNNYIESVQIPTTRLVGEAATSFVQFPNLEFQESGFWSDIAEYIALFYLIALLFPVLWTVKILIVEKETRLVEIMMILGVSRFSISLAHWIDLMIVYFVTAIGVSGVSLAIFDGTSGGYLFLLILLLCIATVSFCFLLSSLFNRSKIGSILSSMFYVVGYFLTFAASISDGNKNVINVVSLHPFTAFSYGIELISEFEDKAQGMTSENVNDSPYASDYKYRDAIMMLIIDTILYLLLSLYFNYTVSSVGVPLPFYFPCTKRFWCGSPKRDEDAPDANITYLHEPPGPNAVKSVEIVELTKEYGVKTAVDGLSLNFYKNQITSLLGHNGAGKTSLLSMLTGLTSVTSGEAFISGTSVKTGMKQIRRDLGFCPQHDVLFPYLTVEQHLRLFEGLKGSFNDDKTAAKEKIASTMSELALASKSATLSKNLSGGQKRKLSIGIAFAGKVGVVFLDEPTSGMDVHSRRFAWTYVRKMRDEGRTIILSTHFLDEADILSDRVAIMSESRLICVGSPMFLKNAYGVGYQLNIESSSNHADIVNLIVSDIPDAKVLTDVGTELTFQLPATSQHLFPDVLTRLQDLKESGEIVTFGVGVTTLESVFTLIEEEGGTELDDQEEVDVEGDGKNENEKKPDPQTPPPPLALAREPPTFKRHLGALLSKRFYNAKRDKKSFLLGNLFPIVLNALGFLIAILINSASEMDALTLTLDQQNPEFSSSSPGTNPVYFNSVGDNTATFACNAPVNCQWQGAQFCGENIYPQIIEQCSMAPAFNPDFSYLGSTIPATATQVPFSTASTTQEFSTFLQATRDSDAASRYGAIMYTFLELSDIESTGSPFTSTVQITCNGVTPAPSTPCSNFGHYGFTISTNFTALHSSVLYQNIADYLLVRGVVGNSRKEFEIQTTIHPLPFTAQQNATGKAADAFISWFIMIASFPFILASFAAFVVRENETGSKYLQKISGVSIEAYWISSFLFDMISYTVTAAVIVGLMFAFNAQGLTTTDFNTVGGIVSLLFLFGPAAAGFTYIMSLFFESPASAQGFVVVFNFLVGLAAPLACLILIIIDPINNKDVVNGITWALRWIPSFAFGHGLLFAINVQNLQGYAFGEITSVFSTEIMLWDLIFLVILAPVYLLLVIVFDRYSVVRTVREWLRCACCKCGFDHGANKIADDDDDLKLEEVNSSVSTLTAPIIDEEVLAQRAIVEASLASDNVTTTDVVIDSLSKVYPNGKVAVNEMSLAVSGEIFGLLGVNGAGKTSLIKVLVGDELLTSGDAYLRGNSVKTDMLACRDSIGYCPQFDSLFDCMTGREHLSFYAQIKGITNIPEVVSEKLKSVGISDVDADKATKSYSGGMRRKISFSIATIAAPPIVFLDEPSTGMDPVSRRKMWKTISELECTMFLTTHSMEECEALCHRLTIMVEGKLTCLGSAQRLKDRYGMGYLLKVKLAYEDVEDVDESLDGGEVAVARVSTVIDDHVTKFTLFLKNACPSTTLSERNELSLSFSIQKDNVSGIADLFRLIQDCKEEYGVEDYSVSQTSLEDIFRGFSKENDW